jgi:rRNA processing protein Gar1
VFVTPHIKAPQRLWRLQHVLDARGWVVGVVKEVFGNTAKNNRGVV